MAIRVAVDAMGGDEAPRVVVEGALAAVEEAPDGLEVVLFGPQALVEEAVERHAASRNPRLHIVDAPDVIEMGEAPAAAVKTKQRSSIHLGLGAHAEGSVMGFVSAGNTGAVMAASLFILGRLPGISRPSVLGYYPTTESYCIVLDVGTNVDSKPEHFVQFAQMGTLYARSILKREHPVVGLMNIGEEPGKGNEQVKEAYQLLQDAPGIDFRGNIEGRDLLHHAADVVVCDGFVGNIMLKLGESLSTAFPQMVARVMKEQGLSAAEQELVGSVLAGVRRRFDYEEYGGAPLLGVDGNVIIGHGGSSSRAIARMIGIAAEEAKVDLAGAIADSVSVAAE